MPSTNIQKLRIKEGTRIVSINAPSGYKQKLGSLPAGADITSSAEKPEQVHWFVTDKAQMEREIHTVLPLIKEETLCWIFYPKGTSGIQTDLTRDKGWEQLLQHDMQWVNLISFDDTWSAFGMRQKNKADKTKSAQPRKRPVFDFVDPVTKTVKLPEDFSTALKKNRKQKQFFESLSFTNKKEYLEWIVTAKREDTRATRVKESIERLGLEWKNPANR